MWDEKSRRPQKIKKKKIIIRKSLDRKIKKMDKKTISEINAQLKNISENKTYTLDILENYRVLHIRENGVKALNDYGFTELKTTYISSKKYSENILDILIKALKEKGFTQKN